jgi:hypothetical protein
MYGAGASDCFRWTLSPPFWPGFSAKWPIRGPKLQNRIDFLPNHGDESRKLRGRKPKDGLCNVQLRFHMPVSYPAIIS